MLKELVYGIEKGKQMRLGLIAGAALGAMFALTSVASATVVANLGTLVVNGPAQTTSCNTVGPCQSSIGTAGGVLPFGVFNHQVIFKVSAQSRTISSATLLDRADYDVANVSFQLFELSGAIPAIGSPATPLGAALAAAISVDLGSSRAFSITFATLDPLKTYYLQLAGTGLGVLNGTASYTTQVSVSAVPLPPALLLLGAALAGLFGFSRIKRNRAAA